MRMKKEDQNTEYKQSWRGVCLKWISSFPNAWMQCHSGVLLRDGGEERVI